MACKKSQQGVLLISMMISIIIIGILSAALLKFIANAGEDRELHLLGNKLAEHSRAVMHWVIDQAGTAIPGTRVGTDWLKSNTDCGITSGGSTAYLSCSLTFSTGRFGGTPTTVITNTGGVTKTVTTWPALNEGGNVKAIGAARVVNQAQANNRQTLQGVITYSEDLNGIITAIIEVNNAESIYVKRTGDSMTGNLDLGGNNLNNVGVISASSGSFNTSSLGNASATSVTTNNLSAAVGNIGTLTNSTLTSTDGTITNLTATNITTSDMTVSGTVRINRLNGDLQIKSVKAPDSACIGTGRLAVTALGDLLTCKSGTWQQAEASSVSVDYSSCYYVNYWYGVYFNSCPANYAFVGGYRRGSDSDEWNGFNCCKLR